MVSDFSLWKEVFSPFFKNFSSAWWASVYTRWNVDQWSTQLWIQPDKPSSSSRSSPWIIRQLNVLLMSAGELDEKRRCWSELERNQTVDRHQIFDAFLIFTDTVGFQIVFLSGERPLQSNVQETECIRFEEDSACTMRLWGHTLNHNLLWMRSAFHSNRRYFILISSGAGGELRVHSITSAGRLIPPDTAD